MSRLYFWLNFYGLQFYCKFFMILYLSAHLCYTYFVFLSICRELNSVVYFIMVPKSQMRQHSVHFAHNYFDLKNFLNVFSYYSQTYSNNHLYKTKTHLRWPTLSLPNQIPIQSLLYRKTTCLTWTATTFFISKMKKNLSKTTNTKFYPAKATMLKNKRLSDYSYSVATL